MANILCARENPPFGWYYSWIPLDDFGTPDKNHSSALKQPETIKVRWEAKGSAEGSTVKDMVAEIIPDKGLFGCEFAMIYTFPNFNQLIRRRLDDKSDNHVKDLYDLMGRCFQHQAKTIWDQVADKFTADNLTVDTFLNAQRDYLKMVAECKNIGDCLIRQLQDRAKPAVMKIDTI